VPQDIHSNSHAKNLVPKSESPKVDKPLSPSARKTFPETSKPLSPKNNNALASAASNLTSPCAANLGHDATHQSARQDPTEHQEVSPQSPKSFRLGAHGGPQNGEGPFVPRPEKQLHQYLHVAESLWDNLDFIQARYHIG
jgi:hypothetical protein